MPFMEEEKARTGQAGQARGKILMATVKGDVHDIGKNIVGVVLGCNNYQVIDLGVMVPCEQILETAVKEGVDMIGLSGLITPSLDEMVHVAARNAAAEFQCATAHRRRHDQRQAHGREDRADYERPTIHVLDASRSVGVVEQLLNPEIARAVRLNAIVPNRRNWSKRIINGSKSTWSRTTMRGGTVRRPIGPSADRHAVVPGRARAAGRAARGPDAVYRLVTVLPGVGVARQVPEDLRRSNRRHGRARVVRRRSAVAAPHRRRTFVGCPRRVRLLAGRSQGDDIVVYANDQRDREIARFHTLRQQWERKGQKAFYALADFIAPVESGRKDYLGAFAVTTGLGTDELVRRFEAEHDDHGSILVKSLADRLAEAFAEMLHQQRGATGDTAARRTSRPRN